MSYSINQAELLIDKLLNYYNVSTYSDLGIKINVSQANISSWKIRNSVNAIKNKCKELGIYNEIFGDLKLSTNEEESNQEIDNDVFS
jgi:5'(3')-deoxyribonucleotidase